MRGVRGGPPIGVMVAIVLLIQLAGTHVAASHQTGARPLDGLAYLLLIAGPLLLLLRKKAPEVMLGGVIAVTALYFWLGFPWGPVVLSLALAVIFATAARRRVFSWSVSGAVIVFLIVWGMVGGGSYALVRSLAVSAWLIVMVLLGEALRVRRERAAERRAQVLSDKRRAEDEYRLTLTRDIHDVVAHSLSMINVRASVALHLADKDPDQLRPALEAIKTASKESLVEVRALLGVLRDDAPLAPALRLDQVPALVEQAGQSGMAVTLERGGLPPLPPDVETAAYRVVQESVTNAVRHSGGTRIRVRINARENDRLRLDIDDDGAGNLGAPEGNGLRGLRERVAQLGGDVEFRQLHPGRGVRVSLPLRAGSPDPGTGKPGKPKPGTPDPGTPDDWSKQ